ncbi:hypothetical protein BHE74_00001234 [Ensete ventricosum]
MPPRRFAFGRTEDAIHPDTMRAALSEFIATALFVFAAEGSILSLGEYDCRFGCMWTLNEAWIYACALLVAGKLYKDTSTAGGLVVVAIAHALALAVAVAIALNISGGHVNPAVTLGALVGGRISLVRAVLYWVAQLLGAVVAALLLRLATVGGFSCDMQRPVGFSVASGISDWHAVLLEIVMTFGLVYTVYATAIDPKRGHLGTIAPLAIGFILGANILAGGPFDGAAMNPARAFGPALIGWRWKHHWVYWVGPFIGAALAGLVYEFLMIPAEAPRTHQPLAPEDY